MFRITDKIRSIVVLGAVSAVAVTLACSGVASAATVIHRPGTVTTPLVGQPSAVAQVIDPSNVGSAGVPGYDDAACEDLANEINSVAEEGISAARNGDSLTATIAGGLEQDYEAELEDNCLVID